MRGGTYGYNVFTYDESDPNTFETGVQPYNDPFSHESGSFPECTPELLGTSMYNCGPAFVKVWKGAGRTRIATTTSSETTLSASSAEGSLLSSTALVESTTITTSQHELQSSTTMTVSTGQGEVQQETISGTFAFRLSGASTQEQVETSATKSIAAELQVDEEAVSVSVNSARRLEQKEQVSKFRQLATAWTIAFFVSVLPSQLSHVQAKVADLKADSTSLGSTLKAKLVESGVPEAAAEVTVESFETNVQTLTVAPSGSNSSLSTSMAASSTSVDSMETSLSGCVATTSASFFALAAILIPLLS
jgi:hypothetical protein